MSADASQTGLPTATLHVTDGAGAAREAVLTGPRAVVGRAQDADVRLDSGMVSRHHAEFTRDAFGGWAVRDMHSRNGTLVNGVAVAARALRRGDRVAVGPFTLTLAVPAGATPAGEPATTPRLPVSDADAGRITTLGEIEPSKLSASHLNRLSDFSRDLLATEDPGDRLVALCRLLVGAEFRGFHAYALRLPGPDPDAPPSPLCEPQRAGASAGPGERPAPDAKPAQDVKPAQEVRPARNSPGPPEGSGPVDLSARISRAVLRAVRGTGEAVLAGNTGRAGLVEVSIPSSLMLVAAVAVPLRPAELDAAELDLLYVTLPPDCGSGEWLALTALAVRQYQQAEDAWAARRQAEAHAVLEMDLRRARDIQTGLVPRDPRVAGLELALGFRPCRWVGGDYVDVVPMRDGRTLLAVADVSGKGLPAALIASGLHTTVHVGLDAGMDLPTLMACLNRYLFRTLDAETYVTMVAVAIDPATGEFECVNAGHPPAALLTPGGGHRELQSAANYPLACNPAGPVGQRGRMEPGQVLCLYTDGLTELFDPAGTMIGTEGLCRRLGTIYAGAVPSAQDAADALARGLDELKGPRLADDRTFLLARRA